MEDGDRVGRTQKFFLQWSVCAVHDLPGCFENVRSSPWARNWNGTQNNSVR
jgi:hypothetical protein